MQLSESSSINQQCQQGSNSPQKRYQYLEYNTPQQTCGKSWQKNFICLNIDQSQTKKQLLKIIHFEVAKNYKEVRKLIKVIEQKHYQPNCFVIIFIKNNIDISFLEIKNLLHKKSINKIQVINMPKQKQYPFEDILYQNKIQYIRQKQLLPKIKCIKQTKPGPQNYLKNYILVTGTEKSKINIFRLNENWMIESTNNLIKIKRAIEDFLKYAKQWITWFSDQKIKTLQELQKQYIKIQQILKKEESEQKQKQILKLYAEDTFFHILINRSFRSLCDCRDIIYMRYIFYIFHKTIKSKYQQTPLSLQKPIKFYRGCYMFSEQLKELKSKCREYIELLGLISASQSQQKAKYFGDGTIIEIIIPKTIQILENQIGGFINMQQYSNWPGELEFFFNNKNLFKIIDVQIDKKKITLQFCDNESIKKNQQIQKYNQYTNGIKIKTQGDSLYYRGDYQNAFKYYIKEVLYLVFNNKKENSLQQKIIQKFNQKQFQEFKNQILKFIKILLQNNQLKTYNQLKNIQNQQQLFQKFVYCKLINNDSFFFQKGKKLSKINFKVFGESFLQINKQILILKLKSFKSQNKQYKLVKSQLFENIYQLANNYYIYSQIQKCVEQLKDKNFLGYFQNNTMANNKNKIEFFQLLKKLMKTHPQVGKYIIEYYNKTQIISEYYAQKSIKNNQENNQNNFKRIDICILKLKVLQADVRNSFGNKIKAKEQYYNILNKLSDFFGNQHQQYKVIDFRYLCLCIQIGDFEQYSAKFEKKQNEIGNILKSNQELSTFFFDNLHLWVQTKFLFGEYKQIIQKIQPFLDKLKERYGQKYHNYLKISIYLSCCYYCTKNIEKYKQIRNLLQQIIKKNNTNISVVNLSSFLFSCVDIRQKKYKQAMISLNKLIENLQKLQLSNCTLYWLSKSYYILAQISTNKQKQIQFTKLQYIKYVQQNIKYNYKQDGCLYYIECLARILQGYKILEEQLHIKQISDYVIWQLEKRNLKFITLYKEVKNFKQQ